VVLAVEEPVGLAQLDVGAGAEADLADGADDAVGVEEARADFGAQVFRLEIDPAAGTPRTEPSVVVPLAEEGVVAVGKAGGVEVDAAVEAPQAVAVEGARLLRVVLVVDVVEEIVGYG